jgi:dihydroorotate dehydrogenase (NAD+) catalytic subunit
VRRKDRATARSVDAVEHVDLRVRLGPIELPNPIVAASGTFGHGVELSELCPPAELGAVTVKSLAAFPWSGNEPLRVTAAPGGGMLNSVGLAGPGVDAWIEHDLPALREHGARVIASVWGRTVGEFADAASRLTQCASELLAVEVNASCPNLDDRARVFAHAPSTMASVIAAVVDALPPATPVLAKLSPNVTDMREIAIAAVEAGAIGLTLVNTVMGLVVDPEARRARLGAGGGGLSGPPIKPIAIRAVWEVHGALPEVPIVGTGGVSNGTDAVEMLLAGASAVGVGTATFADPRAPIRVRDELAHWCARQGVTRVADLIGALPGPPDPTSAPREETVAHARRT